MLDGGGGDLLVEEGGGGGGEEDEGGVNVVLEPEGEGVVDVGGAGVGV